MFQFKQFTVQQDKTPMKVGTDGVLLGAWAAIGKANTILDIGTGTGLIALMCAQRNPLARIDALEIEPHACEQATENIQASPWHDRIQVIHKAIQVYSSPYLYDSIVCNPPFFLNSTKAPDSGRNLARHADTLSHLELLENASRLLAPGGNFSVILPTQESASLLETAKNYELYPQHITYVLPNPGKPAKRLLIRFVTKPVASPTRDQITVELSRHQYSKEYRDLTGAFYLYL